jgi:dihydroneopterin aldolase
MPVGAATMPRAWVSRRHRRILNLGGIGLDIVFLRGLRIDTVIGIYDWEKAIKQTVVFDIEMAADVARAAASDRIEDTLDYKAISKRLKQFVGEARFELVETLAERCATIIREEFGVPWVRLTLDKVGAVSDAQGVGVIIERGEQP